MGRIPLALKIVYAAWCSAWLVVYGWTHPAVEFLWICHLGNVIVGVGLWMESRLLLSWQAVALSPVQIPWTADVLFRAVVGRHLIGGTEFLFDPSFPPLQVALALFHVAMPFLLLWAVWRLGYDRRALSWQTVAYWIVLPASFLAGPARNINWVYGPFGQVQSVMPEWCYLLICMAAYPLLLHLPAHLMLRWLFPVREPHEGASANSSHQKP